MRFSSLAFALLFAAGCSTAPPPVAPPPVRMLDHTSRIETVPAGGYAFSHDGRTLILSRYTHPEPDHKILLQQLKLTLPAQPPASIIPSGLPPARFETARVANTPVRRAPSVPPTPWTPKASSESS